MTSLQYFLRSLAKHSSAASLDLRSRIVAIHLASSGALSLGEVEEGEEVEEGGGSMGLPRILQGSRGLPLLSQNKTDLSL